MTAILIDACLSCGVNPCDVRRSDSTFGGMIIPGVMSSVCSECQAKVKPKPKPPAPGPVRVYQGELQPDWRPKQHFPDDWPTDEECQRWSRDHPQFVSLQSAGVMPGVEQSWDDSLVGSQTTEFTEQPVAVRDWLAQGGWSVAMPKTEGSGRDGGITTHRGILFAGEYVDPFDLRDLVCEGIGYTYEQVSSVYKQGRKSDEQRQLRAKIDACLLALSRGGANMTVVATALLLDDNVITSALSRARAARLK